MSEKRAVLEAILYVTDDPLTVDQLSKGLEWPKEEVEVLISELTEAHAGSERGVEIRNVAGGYKVATKAEHHEAVRRFVRSLKPALKLSIPALETLSVIAYKQPVTVPEIQEIRGVNAGGVIHTLLSHKLITTAGRKQVIGRPILYKTTREFLVQFGLNDLSELPSLKEFEELSRAALAEGDSLAIQNSDGAENTPAEAAVQQSGETPPVEAAQNELLPEEVPVNDDTRNADENR